MKKEHDFKSMACISSSTIKQVYISISLHGRETLNLILNYIIYLTALYGKIAGDVMKYLSFPLSRSAMIHCFLAVQEVCTDSRV